MSESVRRPLNPAQTACRPCTLVLPDTVTRRGAAGQSAINRASTLTCCSAFNSVNTPSVTADASHRAELGLIAPPRYAATYPRSPPRYAATYPGTGAAPGRRGRMKWWINFTSAGFYGDDLTIHPCANSCRNSSDSGGS